MNIDQIAETCESVLPLADTPQTKQIRVEQIKTAIEEALKRQRDYYGYVEPMKRQLESRAAQAGDVRDALILGAPTIEAAEKIVNQQSDVK